MNRECALLSEIAKLNNASVHQAAALTHAKESIKFRDSALRGKDGYASSLEHQLAQSKKEAEQAT
jgi:hypothetical protein